MATSPRTDQVGPGLELQDTSEAVMRRRASEEEISTEAAAHRTAAGKLGQNELKGWYCFDWANSAYSTVVIGGFLPLLLQESALSKAGFPGVCPNIDTNLTRVHEVFGATVEETEMFRDVNPQYNEGCDAADSIPQCSGGYCRGLPGRVSECLEADGSTLHSLRVSFGAIDLDPTAYATLFISLSVLMQVVTFVSVGSLADFGPYRKKLLIMTSVAGSVFCMLCVAVSADSWWLGGILTILSNVCYGTTFVFYNGWLPLLAAETDAVKQATPEQHRHVLNSEMERISANGFAYGYASGVIMIVIALPMGFFVDAMTMYRVMIFLAGLWWAVFALYTFKHLHARPGPPLPAGTKSYLAHSWKTTCGTIRDVRKLKTTFTFLILWFTYSDGFTVISSIGALFANSEVDFGCFPQGLALGIIFLEVPLAAMVGTKVVERLANKHGIKAQKLVVVSLAIFAILPIYGLFGFASNTIGLRQGWELFLFSGIFGLNLGVIQSYSRCLMAMLIPPGAESEMFGLYEITDKGSSWLGPAVIAAVQQSTGNIRYGFIYITFMLVVPAFFVASLDFDKGREEAIAYAKERAERLGLLDETAVTPVDAEVGDDVAA